MIAGTRREDFFRGGWLAEVFICLLHKCLVQVLFYLCHPHTMLSHAIFLLETSSRNNFVRNFYQLWKSCAPSVQRGKHVATDQGRQAMMVAVKRELQSTCVGKKKSYAPSKE